MKIEHPTANVDATSRVSADKARVFGKPAVASEGDAVRLSADLQLAERALRAAAGDTDRSDVVTRLRELHERGELGVDVDQLADRMIDALIHSDVDNS